MTTGQRPSKAPTTDQKKSFLPCSSVSRDLVPTTESLPQCPADLLIFRHQMCWKGQKGEVGKCIKLCRKPKCIKVRNAAEQQRT